MMTPLCLLLDYVGKRHTFLVPAWLMLIPPPMHCPLSKRAQRCFASYGWSFELFG